MFLRSPADYLVVTDYRRDIEALEAKLTDKQLALARKLFSAERFGATTCPEGVRIPPLYIILVHNLTELYGEDHGL